MPQDPDRQQKQTDEDHRIIAERHKWGRPGHGLYLAAKGYRPELRGDFIDTAVMRNNGGQATVARANHRAAGLQRSRAGHLQSLMR